MANSDCYYTIRIIDPDGKQYYEIKSAALSNPKELDEFMKTLVAQEIRATHQDDPTPDPAPEKALLFCGTYYVNLAALKKPGG